MVPLGSPREVRKHARIECCVRSTQRASERTANWEECSVPPTSGTDHGDAIARRVFGHSESKVGTYRVDVRSASGDNDDGPALDEISERNVMAKPGPPGV